MPKLIYRKLTDSAIIPKEATSGSACSDIYADMIAGAVIRCYFSNNNEYKLTVRNDAAGKPYVSIPSLARVLIPTGWAVKLPKDYSMRIYSRSGTALKRGLLVFNGVGIVDSDYRDEVFVILTNTADHPQKIYCGDRIAQLDFAKNLHSTVDCATIECANEDWYEKDNERKGGFGSTDAAK